jgi:hypothetical protein
MADRAAVTAIMRAVREEIAHVTAGELAELREEVTYIIDAFFDHARRDRDEGMRPLGEAAKRVADRISTKRWGRVMTNTPAVDGSE